MHVQAPHLLNAGGDCRGTRPFGGFRSGELKTDRVKQECARAAGRVEHPLRQRIGQRPSGDFGRQPIGDVIFAEVVALGRVYQAFVKRLQYVVHFGQPHLMVDRVIGDTEPVTQDIGDERAHQFVTHQYPVAGLDPATHVFFLQAPPLQDVDDRVEPGRGGGCASKHLKIIDHRKSEPDSSGLVPAIHDAAQTWRFPWMPGTRPGTTSAVRVHHLNGSEH